MFFRHKGTNENDSATGANVKKKEVHVVTRREIARAKIPGNMGGKVSGIRMKSMGSTDLNFH